MTTTSINPSKHEENPDQVGNHESTGYSPYSSLFDSYPLLRSRSRPLSFTGPDHLQLSSLVPSSSTSSTLSSISTVPSSLSLSTRSRSSSHSSNAHPMGPFRRLPDLRPLKLAIASKSLDPSKRLCHFEVPGGGVCRDAECQDVHLSRMGNNHGLYQFEPSDEDTADYLSTALPASWLTVFGSSLVIKIITALQQARHDKPSLVFEERVARALAALEPSLSTPT